MWLVDVGCGDFFFVVFSFWGEVVGWLVLFFWVGGRKELGRMNKPR